MISADDAEDVAIYPKSALTSATHQSGQSTKRIWSQLKQAIVRSHDVVLVQSSQTKWDSNEQKARSEYYCVIVM